MLTPGDLEGDEADEAQRDEHHGDHGGREGRVHVQGADLAQVHLPPCRAGVGRALRVQRLAF